MPPATSGTHLAPPTPPAPENQRCQRQQPDQPQPAAGGTPAPAPLARDAGADADLVRTLCADARVVVLTGHYGVGKTNLALNLALACAAAGERVTLADLDLVNPYFRSSDYPRLLEKAGVELDAPVFARTSLDTPSVNGQLFSHIELARAQPGRRLIVDVGGDDAGATALGRYAASLAGARMLYVVNAFRDLTREPAAAAEVLREIEGAAHLRACGVVNNSHLCDETCAADVERGRAWAHEAAQACGLPLVATCVPARLVNSCISRETIGEPLVCVGRYVNTPWA